MIQRMMYLSFAFIACFAHAQSGVPVELSLTEPDWLELSGGRWTPWVMDDDGDLVWNPSVGYNRWVNSIPEEDWAYPHFVDFYYEHNALIEYDFINVTPFNHSEDWNENGLDDWDEIRDSLKDFDLEAYVNRLEDITKAEYLGSPMLPYTSPAEERAIRKYGAPNGNPDSWIEKKSNIPNTENPSVLSCFDHTMGFARRCLNLNRTIMSYVVEQGRTDLYIRLAECNLHLARFARERAGLINSLVGMAIVSANYSTIVSTLYHEADAFNEDQLVQLQELLAKSEPEVHDYTGELLMQHDAARRMLNAPELVRTDGDMDLVQPLNDPYNELDEAIRVAIALVVEPTEFAAKAALQHQLDTAPPAWHEVDPEELDLELSIFQTSFVNTILPALGKTTSRHRATRAMNHATRIAIAAHRHRLRHGQFPASLENFDQDLIDFEHFDPFVRGSLLYRLDEQLGPMVYARGYDGDDDLGHHERDVFMNSNRSRTIDGDFVYYPDPYSTQPHLMIDE